LISAPGNAVFEEWQAPTKFEPFVISEGHIVVIGRMTADQRLLRRNIMFSSEK